MPGRVLQMGAAAIVLFISIPVLTLAVFTSITALILLAIHTSVLQSEFWVTVLYESWHHQADATPIKRPAPPKLQPSIEFRPPMPRSRTNSFVVDPTKRLSHRSDSHVSLVGTPINRDFEGVGGWRAARDEDDQMLWTNMKTRLDRTRSSSRHHKRSVTSGSLQSTALNSPELFPVALRTPRTRLGTSGSTSPQSYFQLPTSRSMVSLQAKRSSGTGSDRWELERGQSMDLERENAQIGVAI